MIEEDINYFITSFVSGATAFSLYKLIVNQTKVFSQKKLIGQIKQAPIKSPDEELAPGQLVIVQGTAQPNVQDKRYHKITKKTGFNKTEDYILFIKYKEAIYSNENFTSKQEYVINFKDLLGRADITINSSFLIQGLKRNVSINNFDNVDYSSVLQMFKWESKKRKLNWSQKLEVLLLAYLRGVGTLVISDKLRPSYLRGIDIGTREIETGVKVGSSILALGTIGLTMDGQIFMEPNILFRDRLSVITKLSDLLKSTEESRNFWALLFLIGGVYLARRAYKYDKKHKVIDKIKAWWNKK